MTEEEDRDERTEMAHTAAVALYRSSRQAPGNVAVTR